MWGTDCGSGYAIPSDIKPAFGQRREDFAEVSRIKQTWDVFQQGVSESGSQIANTLDRLRPLVARVFFASPLSRIAEWRTGKTCCKYIDKARVFFRCTGLDETVNVSEDWGFVKEPVIYPRPQYLGAIQIVLNVSNGFEIK